MSSIHRQKRQNKVLIFYFWESRRSKNTFLILSRSWCPILFISNHKWGRFARVSISPIPAKKSLFRDVSFSRIHRHGLFIQITLPDLDPPNPFTAINNQFSGRAFFNGRAVCPLKTKEAKKSYLTKEPSVRTPGAALCFWASNGRIALGLPRLLLGSRDRRFTGLTSGGFSAERGGWQLRWSGSVKLGKQRLVVCRFYCARVGLNMGFTSNFLFWIAGFAFFFRVFELVSQPCRIR